ncbi:hypothetical protein [Pyrodictium abyssi]|uniref:Uncharacterized protein n=1 Tax=Pyrodictium abyssi TaxID=54256 RepID=A0ABM8IXF4_9CREN|nr:hypothetical protein PABY_17730 [Pyrodictium abyssi]
MGEGFFATARAWHRLPGYSTGYMLVEPMEPGAFQALYEEYRGRHGCSVDLDTFIRLVGASPGYLVDLCPRDRELLGEWLRGELHRLDHALDLAAEAAGLDRREAIRAAARLLGHPSTRRRNSR